MATWTTRPLNEVYAAIFIDAIIVKVRDGQVANRPVYAAIGVTLAGEKDVLGLWAGTGGEGAKFWMSVLTDLRNRGVKDTFFVVRDGSLHPPTVHRSERPRRRAMLPQLEPPAPAPFAAFARQVRYCVGRPTLVRSSTTAPPARRSGRGANTR